MDCKSYALHKSFVISAIANRFYRQITDMLETIPLKGMGERYRRAFPKTKIAYASS